MDQALFSGSLDRSVPFIKKVGVEALTEVGETLGEANDVRDRVLAFYREKYSDLFQTQPEKIEAAAQVIASLYTRNVFPKMNLTWGTYPNNIGHENFPGCFRCHDGEHESSDGKFVEQDCETCHKILAWDEEDPEVLQQLGISSH
jgi:hypothetical protein